MLKVSVELTEDELRHLRFMMGGPASFEDIKRVWSSQKFLHPIFDKLIEAEKHIRESVEKVDEVPRLADEPGQVVSNNRRPLKV